MKFGNNFKLGEIIGWTAVSFVFFLGIYGAILGTRTLWPGVHQDGALFTTLPINIAANRGFTFNVFDFQLHTNERGNSFSGHGLLYYPCVAALMSGSDYSALLRVFYILNIGCYLVATAVFYLLSRRALHISPMASACLGVAAAFSISSVLVYLQGRPEHGIPIVIVLFLLLREALKIPSLPSWVWGIQIGIVGAISPLPGAFLGACWASSSALERRQQKPLFLDVTLCTVCAALVWAAVSSLLFSGSLREYMQGIVGSVNAYNKVDHILPRFPQINWNWFTSSWLKGEYTPGIGLLYLAAVAVAAYSSAGLFRFPGLFVSKGILLICISLSVPGIWRIGFAHSPINYTFLCLFPAIAAWLLKFIGKSSSTLCNSASHGHNTWASLILALFLGLPGFGYLKLILHQPSVLKQGIAYESTLKRVQVLKASLKDNEVILIDLYSNARSAVIFDAPPWRFRAFEEFLDGNLEALERNHGVFARYRIYLQEGDKPPPTIKGFELLEINFNSIPVEYFGIKISKTTPGFGYAIYGRLKTSD